jgi:NAD(P)-dependent dehydrogenase (short-subunit alcohol dehydrogenase family)
MRGIAGFTFDKMLHTMPDEAYDIIMKVHVRAPFRLVRAAAPYFRVKVMRQLFLRVKLLLILIIGRCTREPDHNNGLIHHRPPR